MEIRENLIFCDELEGFVKEINGETIFDLANIEEVQQEVERLRWALRVHYPNVDFDKQLEIRATMREGVGYLEILGNRSQIGIPGIEPLTRKEFFELVENMQQRKESADQQIKTTKEKNNNQISKPENQLLLGEGEPALTFPQGDDVPSAQEPVSALQANQVEDVSDLAAEGIQQEPPQVESVMGSEVRKQVSEESSDGSQTVFSQVVDPEESDPIEAKPTEENDFNRVNDLVVNVNSVDLQAYTVFTKAAPEMKSRRSPKFRVKDEGDLFVFVAAMLTGARLQVSFKLTKKSENVKFFSYDSLKYSEGLEILSEALMELRILSEIEDQKKEPLMQAIAELINSEIEKIFE